MSQKVEYRVRPVTRYIVTRYVEYALDPSRPQMASGMSEQRGSFDNAEVAYHVAYALCKAEHDASGEEVGSMNFIYPEVLEGMDTRDVQITRD